MSLSLRQKGWGSTNVFVFDAKNALIGTLDIDVIAAMERPQPVREERYEEGPGRVRIYNVKGSLASHATYQCIQTNCELVDKPQVAVPQGGAAAEKAR